MRIIIGETYKRMRRKFFIGVLTFFISILFCFGFIACGEGEGTTVQPKKLGNVTIELEDDVATWKAVKNASRYAYQIDNDEIVETTLRKVVLEDGESIRVKAVGDGINYTDGSYTKWITYTAPQEPLPPELQKLGQVSLTLTNDIITWSPVENAVRYAYQINDGEIVETTLRKVVLEDGDSIVVKSIGDGENYVDGDYCQPVKYTASVVETPEPEKLGTVSVVLNYNEASWTAVNNAIRYAYQINDEEVVETTLRSVLLDDGDRIKVKAIGDGVDYADGDYSEEICYKKPLYDGEINQGPVVVTINSLDDVSYATSTGGSMVQSANAKTQGLASVMCYYAKSFEIVIPMQRNGEAMTREKLALYDELRLSVLIPSDAVFLGTVPTITIGSQTFASTSLQRDGWHVLSLNVDKLIADGFISSIKVVVNQPASGDYRIAFDELSGVYNEKLDIGNVLIFGDSYSTYEGYIPDGYFYYYADKALSETDVTRVEETWWGNVLSNTDSNLVLNSSFAGSTVSNTTYGTVDAPHIAFYKRLDSLIANNYFENNQVDTIFLYGGTNDSWGGSPLGEAKYSNWTQNDLLKVLPTYCYMIDKMIKNTSADIIVVLNPSEIMYDMYATKSVYYQEKIISAVKAFSEYGDRIHIVALSDHEYNNIHLIGGHPSVTGGAAVKDQILNILYERAYLPKTAWTEYDVQTPSVPVETVIQNFATDIGYHYNATVEVVNDSTHSQDGNGAWKVTETNSSLGGCYLIGQLISSLSQYDEIKVLVYANESAVGTSIYLDFNAPLSNGTLLGTVKAGWNEFTISASAIQLNHPDAASHIRLAFHIANTNGALYFDSIIGVKK